MKNSVFAVLFIIAGAFALPQQDVESRSRNCIIIEGAIKRIIGVIKDPLEINNFNYEYDGNLLQFKAYIDGLLFTGASNIVINHVRNNIHLSLFDFDVVLPEISLKVANSGISVVIFNNEVNAGFEGSIAIKNVRIVGQVKHNGNLLNMKLEEMFMNASLGGIESDVSLVINGNNYSSAVNTFFNDTLPNTLKNYQAELNKLLGQIIVALFNHFNNQ